MSNYLFDSDLDAIATEGEIARLEREAKDESDLVKALGRAQGALIRVYSWRDALLKVGIDAEQVKPIMDEARAALAAHAAAKR